MTSGGTGVNHHELRGRAAKTATAALPEPYLRHAAAPLHRQNP
jgi:hypothetical protein